MRVRRDGADADRGFTVTEILITVVLLGIVVAGILNAVMTGIKASATSRSAARVETAIVNAADRINRAPKRCNYEMFADAAVLSEGWTADRATVTLFYWQAGGNLTSAGEWRPGSGCGASTRPPDLIVQKIAIAITSPDGQVTRNIEVVKSDV